MTSKLKILNGSIQRDELGSLWRVLESRSSSSVFLSWPWISSWISACPDGVALKQLTIYVNHSIVGLVLFSKTNVTRHRFIRSRILALNEYVQPNLNMMIEYNGFLSDESLSPLIEKELLQYLIEQEPDWDEFRLSGVVESNALLDQALNKKFNLHCHIISESVVRRLNLNTVRGREGDFLHQLSRKTRYKLRKYLLEYKAFGKFRVCEANNIEEARDYFLELKRFHQEYWGNKEKKGSFSNAQWELFHAGVIEKALNEKQLQLLKVTAGTKVIGYVYSLLKNGHVYMIQSGYSYDAEKHYHPGYVCLYLVIEYNLKGANRVFDFLAGDNQYKKSFSNESVKLIWAVLQKKRIQFRVERWGREIRRRVLGLSSDVSF